MAREINDLKNGVRYHLLVLAALALGGCDLRYAVLGWPQAEVRTEALPVTLEYREARGGLMLVTGRVNHRADVEFVLDTGAPVTVFYSRNGEEMKATRVVVQKRTIRQVN